jgi:radical SAM superfamily enzyme YgiQ (UPF0313 family)
LRVVLIATYELGRQPFGLASPAAWLRAEGHDVIALDLSRQILDSGVIARAAFIAFHLPMHNAARLALQHMETVRRLNPQAIICCYGLYAPLNFEMLRAAGATHVIGGEFEGELADVIAGRQTNPRLVVLDRLAFQKPDRMGLIPIERYARLAVGPARVVAGYTEASRGCKHLCRHCPIVPVYEGRFRIVPREIVLADVRQQVLAGARHITFGDPDFLNGPGHAIPLIDEFHREFPDVTYDVTIKIEHLLKHRDLLPLLARTGCLFVTSAVESLDDAVLARLEKGHTRQDFFECVDLMRANNVTLAPTFVPFTPWTTRESYLDLLGVIRELKLIGAVAPIQLAIRLLIPAGSRLLELDDLNAREFDRAALTYKWEHPDPEMDRLCSDLLRLIGTADRQGNSRLGAFRLIWERAFGDAPDFHLADRSTIPYLTEPWYC